MLFSSQISLYHMVGLCQALRVGHGAGLSLVDVFEQQGRKGPLAIRGVISEMAQRLKQGDALEDVLKSKTGVFPPLFISTVTVGEQTGNLPEVFHELERYYREQLTLRRQFISDIIWPVFQLFGAIFVITAMLLILGMIAPSEGKPFDPLGMGVGVPGAIRFLSGVAIVFCGGLAIYFIATRALGQRAAVHRFLLSVPAIGPCLQALALARLSLAMKLTLDSSLSAPKALKRSLLASGNGAYEAFGDSVATDVKRGGDVTQALTRCRVFPEEFLQAVHAGEISGQLPEVMGRQAHHYQEVASLRLKVLNRFASIGVWACVACILIFAIFRMAIKVMGIYDTAGSTDLSQPLY
jgi:type II secretory pathway component PulF